MKKDANSIGDIMEKVKHQMMYGISDKRYRTEESNGAKRAGKAILEAIEPYYPEGI